MNVKDTSSLQPAGIPASGLHEQLLMLVRLRWLATSGLVVAAWVSAGFFGLISEPGKVSAVAVALAGLNVIFWRGARKLERTNSPGGHLCCFVQGAADLIALTLLVHYTGGVTNPLLCLYVCYMVVAGMLFVPRVSYILAFVSCVLFGSLILVEYSVPSTYRPLVGELPEDLPRNAGYLAAIFACFASTQAIVVYLTSRLARELRRRGAQLEEAMAQLRREEQDLEQCTGQIARLIHQAEIEESFDVRYENTHLLRCWQVKDCPKTDCPAHGSEDLRCWQIVREHCPDVELMENGRPNCRECEVYRHARPDKLTAIGESFNNMMHFIEQRADETAGLQNQIMHQEKMAVVGQMAAGVAHEIGNPLASISSLVQFLARKTDDDFLKENLSLINTHIERISRIVHDMVNFARPMDSREEEIDVNDLITQVVKIAHYHKRSKNVEMKMNLLETLSHTSANADQITQVFVNLISNALDAMPEGGSLTITTQQVNGNILASFADTGVGMTHVQAEHIFEPFYTTKEVGRGTGLGLSVSDAIVRKLGGRMHVETQPGKGSTFTVYLPIRPIEGQS